MNKLKKGGKSLFSFFVALSLAVMIFSASSWLANSIQESTLLTQSRVFRMIMKEDSVDILGIIKDENKRHTMGRFIAALTDGYVTFELIPVNEGDTFTAVMSSLVEDVVVNRFVYHGKDLVIYGTAPYSRLVESFVENLEKTAYFQKISPVLHTTPVGVDYEITCFAREAVFTGIFGGERGQT